jgi:alpha-tubulin suppressor-like RCC1 family protein
MHIILTSPSFLDWYQIASYFPAICDSINHNVIHFSIYYIIPMQRNITLMTTKTGRLPMKCIQLAHGRRHVLALMEGTSGSSSNNNSTTRVVVSWGAGHFGQLGQGNDVTGLQEPRVLERLLPHAIGGYRVLSIFAGGLHSACIVDTSGGNSSNNKDGSDNIFSSTRVFAWGYNRKNQCGTEGGKCNTVSHPLPMVDVVEEVEISEKTGKESQEGTLSLSDERAGSTASSSTGTRRYQRQRVNFRYLALGRLHTLGLTSTGSVYAWGCTSGGRCGLGESFVGGSLTSKSASSAVFPKRLAALHNRDVVDLAVGDRHSLAMTSSGTVYSWGIGAEGQLGQGHTMNLHTPRVINDLDFSLSSSSTSARAMHDLRQATSSLGGLLSAAPSSSSSLMAKVPFFGALISGATSPTCATAMGRVQANSTQCLSPGSSVAPQDRIEGEASSASPPSLQRAQHKIIKVFASGSYNAALASSGDVFTWGYGDAGNLGHAVPSRNMRPALPLVEPGEGHPFKNGSTAESGKHKHYSASASSTHRWVRETQSFDSRLNILLPRRVITGSSHNGGDYDNRTSSDNRMSVVDVSLGPSHMVLLCSERTGNEGSNDATHDTSALPRTLFDLEEEKWSNDSEKLGSSEDSASNLASATSTTKTSSSERRSISPLKKLTFTSPLKHKRSSKKKDTVGGEDENIAAAAVDGLGEVVQEEMAAASSAKETQPTRTTSLEVTASAAAATSTEDDEAEVEVDEETPGHSHGGTGQHKAGHRRTTSATSKSKQFASAMKHAAKKPFQMMRFGGTGSIGVGPGSHKNKDREHDTTHASSSKQLGTHDGGETKDKS